MKITMPLFVSRFGAAGLLAGIVAGAGQGGMEGALVLGFAGGVVGVVVGLGADSITWLLSRIALAYPADHPIRRHDLWALPLSCRSCGWRVTPEGGWSLRDAFQPPQWCPRCSGLLVLAAPPCPECGTPTPRRPFRLPTSFRQALWGGQTCERCGTDFDKWGRRVNPSPDPPS